MITADQAPAALAQPLQTLKTPILMPTATPAVAAAAPAPVATPAPSVQALSGQPTPTEPQFGHFASALGKALDRTPLTLGEDGKPEPGSWARSLVGAAQKVLAGAGDVSTKPGGGALAGIAETLANRSQRMTAEKQYADAQSQKEKANERVDKELAIEQQKADDLHAYSQIQNLNLQKGVRNQDQAFQEKSAENGKVVADMMRQAHHQELTPPAGISESEFESEFGTGKKYDPDKFQATQIGWTTVDHAGEKTTEPAYAIFARTSDDTPVTKDAAGLLANGPAATRFKEGDLVNGDVLYNSVLNAQHTELAAHAFNQALDALDKDHMTADKMRKNASDLAIVGPAVSGSTDLIDAMQKTATHKDKQGKPTPDAEAATRLLTNYFTPKDLEDHRKNLADEQIRREEADFKKAAKNEFAGDSTKLGQYDQTGVNRAYLATLSPDEQALVMAAGSGQLAIERWDYLLSHTPQFAAAVASTFKDFDSSKLKDYVATQKDFTSGNVSNSLNSAGAMSQHLKDLYDLSTTSAQAPFSMTQDAARRKAVVGQLAPESIKFFSGTKAKPGEQETAEEAGKYEDRLNRRTYIEQKAENAVKKLSEFKQQWANSSPSSIYQAQMPWISPQAQHDLAYILNKGKEPTPEQIAAFAPDTLPPGGLNQPGAPAFQPRTQQPAASNDQGNGAGVPGEVPPQLSEDELSQLTDSERAEYMNQQAAQTKNPATIMQGVPADLPAGAGIVKDRQGNEYWADPATKTIIRPVAVQSSQVSNMAVAARQAAIDAQHKAQTHGTGR